MVEKVVSFGNTVDARFSGDMYAILYTTWEHESASPVGAGPC